LEILNYGFSWGIDRKFIKIMHVVFETLPRFKMEFTFVFCSFSYTSLYVLMFKYLFVKSLKIGKLINTYKAIHKIWYKNRRNFEENFRIPHELSLNFSLYGWVVYELKRAIVPKFYHMILQKLWRKFEWKASKISHLRWISKSINNSQKTEENPKKVKYKSSSKLINLFSTVDENSENGKEISISNRCL
jgi:hypothetical protein